MTTTMTVPVISPEQVARAFLTPRPPRNRRPLVLEGGQVLTLDTPEGTIALQRAGEGPAVLLLHGWEGQASDLAAFAGPLREAGFSVIAMDLPAHGDSTGRLTSIPRSARALRAVGDEVGPLHAVIAHSVGAAVAVEALHAGLVAERAVFVAAPAHYEAYARAFAVAAGLDAHGVEAMLAELRDVLRVDVREVSVPRRAPHLRQRALFVHSTDDGVVAIEDSIASAAAWPAARHLRVEGLGHRRILVDAAVVAASVDFVTAED